MAKLISIGEALIDFIPQSKGVELKDVLEFKRVAGGAPANVCACVSTLGKEAVMLTKLGNDSFGDHIVEVLKNSNVDTNYIKRTKEANTGLAFVSLKEDGNRDFSFYRNPSADMLLESTEIDEDLFKENDILHFCSVDLIDAPVRVAHDQAISYAKSHNCLISFDPNVRLPLWDDHEEYRRVINQYIEHADILKISDEELEFITGKTIENNAISDLFRGNVKIVIYTKGPDGADIYTKDRVFTHKGFKIKAVDTTGSGDSFIGAFIYLLLDKKVTKNMLTAIDYSDYIKFSNAVGAMVASKQGAISSMPNLDEVKDFIE